MRELRNLVPPGVRLRERIKRSPGATAAVLALILLLALIDVGHDAAWTGFGDKTLWDWLQLLIVPTVLAVGGFLFNRSERRNDQEIASQNTQDAALQAYIDHMTLLLIEHGLHSSALGTMYGQQRGHGRSRRFKVWTEAARPTYCNSYTSRTSSPGDDPLLASAVPT